MSPAPSTPLPELVRQAKRLRFHSSLLENRFREERITDGLLRARVLLAGALLFMAFNGLVDVRNVARTSPDFGRLMVHLRFFLGVPAWLVLFLSTWVPGHVRRADWLNALGTLAACSFSILVFWNYAQLFPERAFVGQLLGNLIPCLVLSTFALPIRFRSMAIVTVAACAGGSLFYRLTVLAQRDAEFMVLWTSLLASCGLTLLLCWWRESGDRVMFAQREHARDLNAELTLANAELARLNLEKNEFMAVASHDLRAPLGIVRGFLELLQDGTIAEPTARAKALRQAQAETDRMLVLVDNYLGAHAAEQGALPVHLVPLDLGLVAFDAVERHAGLARAKRQGLTTDAARGQVFVLADPALLAQVTDNFVTNALKFTAAAGTVSVELQLARPAGVARLAVIDDGPGISAPDHARLFQKFGRLGHATTGGETSTGLGLAVARRLATAMQGSVGCESPAPGRRKGALFWIELPLAAASRP